MVEEDKSKQIIPIVTREVFTETITEKEKNVTLMCCLTNKPIITFLKSDVVLDGVHKVLMKVEKLHTPDEKPSTEFRIRISVFEINRGTRLCLLELKGVLDYDNSGLFVDIIANSAESSGLFTYIPTENRIRKLTNEEYKTVNGVE